MSATLLPSRLRPRHRPTARTESEQRCAKGGSAHIFSPDLENNTLSVDLYAPRPEAITYGAKHCLFFRVSPTPDASLL